MAVRPATAGDAPALAALNADVQQLHRDAAPDWFKPPDPVSAVGYFAGLLASDAFQAFVAEVDGRAVGYALARVQEQPETAMTYGGRVVELDQISVDPRYRGTGVGRDLIDAVRAFAAGAGAVRLQLTVWDFNARARHVFEQAGFVAAMTRMVSAAAPTPGSAR